MKEVTYEEWQKNPTVRVMWVWNSKVEDKVKRMVLHFTEKNPSHPVVALTSDNITVANYKHCAEIEKPRRMTNKEIAELKKDLINSNERLIKAKELLTRFIMSSVYFNGKETDLVEEAEQFLKEVEE